MEHASEPARVVVLGAGAIGATIGALLFERGVDCTLVSRGEHGRVIAERGVMLRRPNDARSVKVPCALRLADVAPTKSDLVIVATMAHDTGAALADLDPTVPVASFQNGLLPLDVIARRGTKPALAAMLYLPAERRAPGVIALPAVPVVGSVVIGDWPSGAGSWTRWLAARLAEAGLRAESEPNIAPWVRAKLLTNLGGIVSALCDAPPHDVIEAAQNEARSVWHRANDAFEDIEPLLARVGELELLPVDGRERVGGSTRAALARGDRLETRSLHGPIVERGRAAGVATPVNEGLIRLAEEAERRRWRPGALDAQALRSLLAH